MTKIFVRKSGWVVWMVPDGRIQSLACLHNLAHLYVNPMPLQSI